jgi:hypothetical protein
MQETMLPLSKNGKQCFFFALVSLFWPRIHHWHESQADTLLGDNPNPKYATHNFLWDVLPFLAHVIFQDGIFWIQEFLNHKASCLLLHVLPDWYPSWAEEDPDPKYATHNFRWDA